MQGQGLSFPPRVRACAIAGQVMAQTCLFLSSDLFQDYRRARVEGRKGESCRLSIWT